jgi:hypothetical protein
MDKISRPNKCRTLKVYSLCIKKIKQEGNSPTLHDALYLKEELCQSDSSVEKS